MGNVFAPPPTMRELVREQRRFVARSVRELEKETPALRREETKLVAQIKAAAAQRQMGRCRLLAKDLVRVRKHQAKFAGLIGNMRAVGFQMTTMASTATMAESMRQLAATMGAMNRQMDVPQLRATMFEFSKQSDALGLKEEMLTDAVDDAMGAVDDEEEEDAVVQQVLDEIGIGFEATLPVVPAPPPVAAAVAPTRRQKKVATEEETAAYAALQSRLDGL